MTERGARAFVTRLMGAPPQRRFENFRGPGGFQIHGVKPGLGPNPGASSELEPAHLFVIRAQHLAGLRVHQIRLGARKARYLDVREVIVFGVISPPQHTGARRGVPLLGRFLRPGHWLSLTGAPVRWQGGRKARIKETPAQPRSFRRRCRRSPKEIQCVRDATLVFGPQRKAVCRNTSRCPKIIELTQRGVRDPATLRAMTLKEFKYE